MQRLSLSAFYKEAKGKSSQMPEFWPFRGRVIL